MRQKPRVGVSACLVGEPVRFSGGHCRDRLLEEELAPHLELVPMCPEVESGLGAPRESMRLVGDHESARLVASRSGRDETARLTVWSRDRARAIESMDLDGFILKKGSPTCGMERVRVYREPDMRPGYDGVGIFARELIERYPAMAIEEEGRLHDAGLREHFVTRVFASRAWRGFRASGPSYRDLVAFHEAQSLLLLAHDAPQYRALEAILAAAHASPLDHTLEAYGPVFLRALAQRPTRGSQGRILERLLQQLHDMTRIEREDLLDVIDEYRDGYVPLAVPSRLLLHHVRREHGEAEGQTWFSPWPEEIHLRTQITK